MRVVPIGRQPNCVPGADGPMRARWPLSRAQFPAKAHLGTNRCLRPDPSIYFLVRHTPRHRWWVAATDIPTGPGTSMHRVHDASATDDLAEDGTRLSAHSRPAER